MKRRGRTTDATRTVRAKKVTKFFAGARRIKEYLRRWNAPYKEQTRHEI